MSVVLADAAAAPSARVKGAPEVLMPLLAEPRTPTRSSAMVADWAEHGLRVLLVARRAGLDARRGPRAPRSSRSGCSASPTLRGRRRARASTRLGRPGSARS